MLEDDILPAATIVDLSGADEIQQDDLAFKFRQPDRTVVTIMENNQRCPFATPVMTKQCFDQRSGYAGSKRTAMTQGSPAIFT